MTHPSLVTLDHIDVIDDRFGAAPAREVFGYEPDWSVPSVPVELEARRADAPRES